MKIVLVAATAIALAGTGMATAQTGIDSNANVRAGGTHAGAKASVKKHHRATTGAGVSSGIETRDNNASAKGSLLPGKDRDFSEKYIGAK